MAKYVERSKDIGEFFPEADDDLIICRCEEITKGEIRRAVHLGMWTMSEIKRFLRAGMGLCQGITCHKHVKAILAHELKVPISELDDIVARPPMRPVVFNIYGNEVETL